MLLVHIIDVKKLLYFQEIFLLKKSMQHCHCLFPGMWFWCVVAFALTHFLCVCSALPLPLMC